jgi:predicted  nucleic acid-binding Zn-ribbon protein
VKQQIQNELDSMRKKTNEQLMALQNQIHELQLLNGDLEARSKLSENEVSTIRTTAEYRERELLARVDQLLQASEASAGQVAQLMKQRKKNEIQRRELAKRVSQLEVEKSEIQQKCEAMHKELEGQTGAHASVFPRYIRKVLLEFFLQDGSTREALIPVILNLVECDEKLIQQAKRSWAESTQIISHAFSFFK